MRLPEEQRPQLASGNAANESLHAELNARFKHVPGMYQATLRCTCEAFQFLKLFSHNCAEYMPTDWQASQQLYVNHYVSAFAVTDAEWLTVRESRTPLFSQRRLHSAKVRAARHRVQKPGRVKRHTFNTHRMPAK